MILFIYLLFKQTNKDAEQDKIFSRILQQPQLYQFNIPPVKAVGSNILIKTALLVIAKVKVYQIQQTNYLQTLKPIIVSLNREIQINNIKPLSKAYLRSQEKIVQTLILKMIEQKPYFENLDYLGDGAQLLCLKARNINENKVTALKLLDYTNKKPKNFIDAMKKEYELIKKLSQNEYLVKEFDCFYVIGNFTEEEEIDRDNQDEENQEKFFLVFEMEKFIHKYHFSYKYIIIFQDSLKGKVKQQVKIISKYSLKKQANESIHLEQNQLIQLFEQLNNKDCYNNFQVIFGSQKVVIATKNKKRVQDNVFKISTIEEKTKIENEVKVKKHFRCPGLLDSMTTNSSKTRIIELMQFNNLIDFHIDSFKQYLQRMKINAKISKDDDTLQMCSQITGSISHFRLSFYLSGNQPLITEKPVGTLVFQTPGVGNNDKNKIQTKKIHALTLKYQNSKIFTMNNQEIVKRIMNNMIQEDSIYIQAHPMVIDDLLNENYTDYIKGMKELIGE
ncbi:hypothetical protein ABPG72_020866 [Tetrahymena utriculariae]